MHRNTWKNFERYIAGIFKSTRAPLSGGNGKVTRSDSFHKSMFLSCKYTRSNHKTVRSLIAAERQKAKVEGKFAVCVIGEFDDKQNSFVAIHLQDMAAFCEAVKNGSVEVSLVSDKKRTKPERS